MPTAPRATAKPSSSLELPFLYKPPPGAWRLIGSFLAPADTASLASLASSWHIFLALSLGVISWLNNGYRNIRK